MEMKITQDMLDRAYNSLSDKQKEVLDHYVKRSKKTIWLNTLAIQKGAHLTEEDLSDIDKTMKRLLDWVLLDYIDHGERLEDVRCVCGRSLRYQYLLLNMSNGQVYSYGSTHLKEHLEMPPSIIRDVIRGLLKIDREREDILKKVIRKWEFTFPIDLNELPLDMKRQVEVGLPLLDSQIKRLHRLITLKPYRLKEESFKEQLSPFSPRRRLTVPRKASQTTQTHDYPRLDPLPNETVTELVTYMINGTINSSAASRLYDTLLHVKQRSIAYDVTLEECSDAALAALAQIDDEYRRQWLKAIIHLCEDN